MARTFRSADILTGRLAGRLVSRVTIEDSSRLTIHFADGGAFSVASEAGELRSAVQAPDARPASEGRSPAPTGRQLDYLRFIAKYIARFGRSPAESDIQRHFLVTAPSVNYMVQTLERRGFISRTPGVPRSIVLRFVPPDP